MSYKRARVASITQDESMSSYTSGNQIYSYGGYARKYPRKYGRKYTGKGYRVPYAAIYKAIRSAHWKNRETKMISAFVAEQTINTVGTVAQVNNFPVPNIGTAANQRTGNKIDLVGIKLNIIMHNNNTLPVGVRFLILRVNQGNKYLNTDIQANLFEASSGGLPETSAAPNGTASDLVRQVNRGEFTLLRDKTNMLMSTNVDTGVSRDMVYIRTPGVMEFDDSDFQECLTPRFVFVCVPRQLNNDEGLGANVELSYTVTMYFKER